MSRASDNGIERGAEYFAVIDRGAFVRDAAADDAHHVGGPVDRSFPDLLAGGDVDGYRGFRIGDIHHAVIDQRLSLLAPLVIEAEAPDRDEALDVRFVDLLERAVALQLVAHAVGEHVVGIFAVILQIVERLRVPCECCEQYDCCRDGNAVQTRVCFGGYGLQH